MKINVLLVAMVMVVNGEDDFISREEFQVWLSHLLLRLLFNFFAFCSLSMQACFINCEAGVTLWNDLTLRKAPQALKSTKSRTKSVFPLKTYFHTVQV